MILEEKKRLAILIGEELAERARYDWFAKARATQLPPQESYEKPWRVWLILAGRGFGKTRMGAETIRLWVKEKKARRIALIAKSIQEARLVMVEGVSGLLSVHPPYERPLFQASKRQLLWPCGAIATLYGAEQYEQLRGPQFDAAWLDEFAKFRHQKAVWEQVLFSLRLGKNPRCIITTTPRPSRVLEALLKDPTVIATRGTTFENKENLAASFLEDIIRQFGKTQFGSQELYGELLKEQEGALWKRSLFQYQKPPEDSQGHLLLERIIIAIDPAMTHTENSDETGIVVAGIDETRQAFVLEDLSGRFSPADWGRRVVEAYWHYRADRIVAEVNRGGDLVERIVRSLDPTVSYKAVRATRGKITRAEPVAALYEQGKVFHRHYFELLERQLCEYVPALVSYSPDRLDALVWALTELLLEGENRPLKIWRTE